MADDWDKWLAETQGNLESADVVQSRIRQPSRSAVATRANATADSTETISLPPPQAFRERKREKPAGERDPFFWTDKAAFAGQVASVIGGATNMGMAVSANSATPELWLGLAVSCVITFAICGAVRCLVLLARASLGNNAAKK